MTHKSRKKFKNFMFSSAGCSLLRAEGFLWRPGDRQIVVLEPKKFFSAVVFFTVLVIKTLYPDRYSA
jgi:hypothetical protein